MDDRAGRGVATSVAVLCEEEGYPEWMATARMRSWLLVATW